jgi:amidase
VVTSLPGAPLPPSALDAVRRAARALESAGWVVEEVTPPELTAVDDVFVNLLADELGVIARQLQPVLSESLLDHLERLCRFANARQIPRAKLYTERSRLIRRWSGFFASYPVLIGPNLASPLWPIDADMDPSTGIELLERATRFIAPGNALGIPSLALPLGLSNALPTSVLVYADLWREDLCLQAAQIIESAAGAPVVIDPL